MVPVYIKRIASLEDKPERADVTTTCSSMSSNQHKCFEKLVHLTTPKTYVTKIQNYRRQQRKPDSAEVSYQYGWCDDMVDRNANGSKLSSCIKCRSKRVRMIINNQLCVGVEGNAEKPSVNEVPPIKKASGLLTTHKCSTCTDWSLASNISSMGLLHFSPPENYPKKCVPNVPPNVMPPPTRPVPAPVLVCPNTGEQKRLLPVVDLTFGLLKQAARFMFFNCVHDNKKERWTKQDLTAYAQTCGFPGKIRDEIWDVATKLRVGDTDEPVDYSRETHLSLFRYPASWSDKLPLTSYIELAMHQLFLRIVKSNFELVSQWLK